MGKGRGLELRGGLESVLFVVYVVRSVSPIVLYPH